MALKMRPIKGISKLIWDRLGKLVFLPNLIFLIIIFVYIIWLFNIIENDNQKKVLSNNASAVAVDIDRHYFSYYKDVIRKISLNETILGYLKSSVSEREALIALEVIKQASEADIVYVMDLSGNVKVSTSYGKNKSLKGNNYKFRPYFFNALNGKDYVYCAVGVTTGERGVYFSSPVADKGNIKGVAVIKAPVYKIQDIMRRSEKNTLLISNNGIVFDSTDPRWLYKAVHRLSEKVLKQINEEQQFAGIQISEIGWFFGENTVLIDGVKNYFDINPVGKSGWDIMIYEPESIIAPITKVQWSIILISGLVVVIFLAAYTVVIINVRKRRLAERHILENEKHLRNILGTTSEGFWYFNNTGITLDVNPAICRMLDVKREEILGENISKYLSFETYEKLKNEILRQTKTKDTGFEGVLLRKNREEIFCIINMTPVYRDDGTSAGVFAMITDITEMKEKEKAIIQSEKNYREIFNSVSDSIILFDTENFLILDVNERFCSMFGYKREEAMILDINSVFYGEALTIFSLMRSLEKGSQKVFDHKMRKNNGSVLWCEIILKYINISGEDRILMVIRDIEYRKRAEHSMKYRLEFENLIAQISRDFINLPFEKIDEGIERAIMDVAMFTNCAGGAVFLYDEELSKLFLSHEWHEDKRDSMKLNFSSLDTSDMPYFENVLLKQKKPLIISEVSELPENALNERTILEKYKMKPFVYLPLIKEGKIYGVMGFFGDELRGIKREDELIMLLKIVGEAIVNAMERKKYERTLGDMLNKLKISNEELEAFAYVASHDLKEPLRMISSYVKLLEKRYSDKLDSNARDFINYAVSGAERMNRLIDDLLSYSRVDRMGGEFATFNIKSAVDEAVHYLHYKIKDSGALVEVEGELPEINADYVQMVQLFQNLIDNAIKYKGNDTPRIKIKSEKTADGMVKVSVRDNGIGIPHQYSEKIFVIFQQLHSKDKYPGTGIGLALCKKIVERHGGKIWVESEEGRGSVFYFTLKGKII